MRVWDSMPGLAAGDKSPIYGQVERAIADFIRKRKIVPGTRLPSEPEFIEHFGVSRTTIRKAVENLEHAGLVQKIHGKGTFTCRPVNNGVVETFRGMEPALGGKGIKISNELISRSECEPPEWAGEFAPAQKIHLVSRLKKIKDLKFAIEYRAVDPSSAWLFTERALTEKMLTEVLDANRTTRTKQVTYSITSRRLSEDEAAILETAVEAPILVRKAVYFNDQDLVVSVGLVVFMARYLEVKFDYRPYEKNMWMNLMV